MSLTHEDLLKLRRPIDSQNVGIKIQSLSKDKTKAMLVLYLQHTDVQNRLEEVDPAWQCVVLEESLPKASGTVYVRMRLTLKGVARENIGEGDEPKGAYSDALKRCAMLFGVGRYLYDSETVWVDYNETRDRYKSWTYAEYEAALKRKAKPLEAVPQVSPPLPRPHAVSSVPTATPVKPVEYGTYVVPFGKFKGMTLAQVHADELHNYAAFLESTSKEDRKPMSAQTRTFLDHVHSHLEKQEKKEAQPHFLDQAWHSNEPDVS